MARKIITKLVSIILIVMILCSGLCTGEKGIGNEDAAFAAQTSKSIPKKGTARYFVENMGVGWNLGNSLDAHYGDRTTDANLSQETIWGNPKVSKKLVRYVKKQGFDVIRIPVSWYYHTWTDKDGHLHIYKKWLKRVKQVVDYGLDEGMDVILDSHHDQPIFYAGTDEASMEQVLSNVEDIWSDIAEYFADYDQSLLFDGFNEIDNVANSWIYSDTAAGQMNQMNQTFVDTVRKSGGKNKTRLLLVSTLMESTSDDCLNAFQLPKDSAKNRLIVQVHDYSKQFAQDIEPLFQKLEAFSQKVGAPVIIGEFATTSSYQPKGYRSIHAANYVARAKKHGIRCIYWDDGNLDQYGIVNRVKLSASETEILKALTHPAVYKNTTLKTYSSVKYFVWRTLNQQTGALQEDLYWGTIVTDADGKGLAVPKNSKYITLSLIVGGDASDCKIHYVHFYDKKGSLLAANNNDSGFYADSLAVPAGAAYVRIGINDSYHATSEEKYKSYFKSGDLKLKVGWIAK